MAGRSTTSLLLVIAALFHSSLASIIFEVEHTTHISTTNFKFSTSELDCFKQGKVLYEPERKCYKLLEVGPCTGDNQWLVLDQEEVINGNGNLRSVCRQCPCCGKPYRAVYWPIDGQCHRLLRESKELCPSEGTTLQIDPFGEGECACKIDPPHAEWNVTSDDNGPCYPLYHRGPCNNGEILVASDNTTTCKRDPCSQHNRGNSSELYVKWEDGNGRCYKLGSKGPCQGDSTTFNIHPVTRRPACISRINQIVDLPPNCDTDQNGKCREEINLPSVSDYVSDLLNSAQKKRSKRRTKTNKQHV
ncbi:hypothetical protein L9F63_017343 [Diploptera punctata]|uniref:DUF4789 domain-containing protein n=1 Tax=Diploptera punctata TaxID=6984 RepID=A0AAD7ZZS7_DIPPU|nr:hypothetical protein L9F63_017343 [Diploptera punctata]